MADENTQETNTDAATVAAEAQNVAAAVKAAEAAAETEMKAAADKAAADKAALGSAGDSELIAKIVKERLDTELANIKSKLDGAYKQRDESQAKVAAFEARERENTLKRLAEEGKHKEAYEMQLAEERAANAALAKRNTELSRDVSVRESLRSLSFRNDKAAQMAFQEITSNLVQDENKQWVHRSGISVKEYCDAFSKDEEQSFLFKAKMNSGAGTTTNGGSGNPAESTKSKSLFAMTQAEVIKMAAEGKLGKLSSF
jgi:hypothetical protein